MRKRTMEIPDIDTITTEEQGRDLAVEWQHWMSEQNLSLDKTSEWEVFFTKVAVKFHGLMDEFKENTIIGQDSGGEELDSTSKEMLMTVLLKCGARNLVNAIKEVMDELADDDKTLPDIFSTHDMRTAAKNIAGDLY